MAQGKRRVSRKQLEARLLRGAANVAVPGACDVCVVGGGASGLVAAIMAAEAGSSVVVLERDLECGRTILATGNGRCNFANVDLAPKHYNQPEFVAAVMGRNPLDRILGFFRACGLVWCQEDGRLYPSSLQAASVRNVLLARAVEAGVVLAPAREVLDVTQGADGLVVSFNELWEGGGRCTLPCRSLVIASGGGAPAPASLGIPLVERRPVLCPLACEPSPLSELDGRRAACVATLVRDDMPLARERGEVLFRDYGLSGICVFDLSRLARPGDTIELDLVPDLTVKEVGQRLGLEPGLTVDYHPSPRTALDGMLDPAIADVLWSLADSPWAQEYLPQRLGSVEGTGVLALVKGLPFRVTGPTDESHAQVTAGGIATSAVDPATMGLRGVPDVFACGEALDVDGDCGGYNLSFAWTSGMRAGESAAKAVR